MVVQQQTALRGRKAPWTLILSSKRGHREDIAPFAPSFSCSGKLPVTAVPLGLHGNATPTQRGLPTIA